VKKSDREEAKATRVLHTTPRAPHAARAPQLPPHHASLHHLLRRPPPRHRRCAGRAHRRGPARGSRLNRWARLGPQEQRRPSRCALPLLTLSPSSPSVHSTRTARLCLHVCARHVHAPLACFKEESRSAPSTSPCSSLYPLFLSRFRLFRQRIHFMFLLLASAVPLLLPAVFLNTTTHNHGSQLTPTPLLSTPPPPCKPPQANRAPPASASALKSSLVTSILPRFGVVTAPCGGHDKCCDGFYCRKETALNTMVDGTLNTQISKIYDASTSKPDQCCIPNFLIDVTDIVFPSGLYDSGDNTCDTSNGFWSAGANNLACLCCEGTIARSGPTGDKASSIFCNNLAGAKHDAGCCGGDPTKPSSGFGFCPSSA